MGQKLSYQLPVADGTYRIVLYVAEPYSYITKGQRVFDVALQGAVVDGAVDLVDRAGGALKALALSYEVTASGGQGITLDLINRTTTPAVLNAQAPSCVARSKKSVAITSNSPSSTLAIRRPSPRSSGRAT